MANLLPIYFGNKTALKSHKMILEKSWRSFGRCHRHHRGHRRGYRHCHRQSVIIAATRNHRAIHFCSLHFRLQRLLQSLNQSLHSCLLK